MRFNIKSSTQAPGLDHTASVVLDLVRVSAASYVAYVHLVSMLTLGEQVSSALQNLSHGCVVLFFVLSGYVIAHTTAMRPQSWGAYVAARLSRLHSVALPALTLTLVVSAFVTQMPQVWLQRFSEHHTLLRALVTGFFGNELWFLSSAPKLNGPFWSMGYEFWFYMLFGAWWFTRNTSTAFRWIIPLGVATLCGPKILLMLAPWACGWGAYQYTWASRFPAPARWGLFIFFLTFGFYMTVALPDMPFELGSTRLYWASAFFKDWIVGGLFAIGFLALPRNLKNSRQLPIVGNNIVRGLGDLSYAVYAFHMPIGVLMVLGLESMGLVYVAPLPPIGDTKFFSCLALLITTSLFAGILAERSRPALKRIYGAWFAFLDRPRFSSGRN